MSIRNQTGLAYRLRTLRGIRLKRLRYCVERCAERSDRPAAAVFADMVICYLCCGAVYTDYLLFGFETLSCAQKRNYLTRYRFRRLSAQLNPGVDHACVDDKYAYYLAHGAAMHRTVLRTDAEESVLGDFLHTHSRFVLKPNRGTSGEGVQIIARDQFASDDALLDFIRLKKEFVLEEIICQHPQMARLNPDSINTLRIVFLSAAGQTHFLYCSVRVGRRGSSVDNLCAGGMICSVNTKTGRISSSAWDNDGSCYPFHPDDPLLQFEGFNIPFVAEGVALCRETAEALYREEKLGLVGFDVAVAPDGPVVIEANAYPTHYGWQRPGFGDSSVPTALWGTIQNMLQEEKTT